MPFLTLLTSRFLIHKFSHTFMHDFLENLLNLNIILGFLKLCPYYLITVFPSFYYNIQIVFYKH